ncbi:hypothetical protein BST81_17755 [Leptolyngbya sp. 'hensonii']|uniref:hypothetical protein n=1 Tax=Leptolyngbya sp. 'hensonii' TaxID=1922337 RepID=UPI00094F5330|nr:hypothetical protein [Leptolyngbya sp. 'hensonii']OLP17194.1 hypothetical protein BST81_17755 [Leptolyngbya sp. 'hensonii']
MLSAKPAPWISLLLLLIAYSMFGWYLFGPGSIRYTWLVVECLIPLLTILLTVPLNDTGLRFINWTSSSGFTLILSVFLAFLALTFLVVLRIFIYILLILSTSVLARLDMQMMGLKQWQAFILLLFISFTGLGIGWLCHWFLLLFFAGAEVGAAIHQILEQEMIKIN